MKFIIVTEEILFDGGVSTSVTSIINELVSTGHDVHLVAADTNYASWKELIHPKVRVYLYKYYNFSFLIINPLVSLFAFKLVRNLARLNKYDVCLLNYYSSPLLISKKVVKATTIYNYSGPIHSEISSNQHAPKYRIVAAFLVQKWILSQAEMIISLSSVTSQQIKKVFGTRQNKLINIPNGIDPDVFYPVTRAIRDKLRNNFGISINSKVLGIVSRIEPLKGIDLAIRAFAQLSKAHPDLLLVIVFPGRTFASDHYRNELLRLTDSLQIGDRVVFKTGVPRKKIGDMFRSFDLFLMPSRYPETFGITTVEALGCGVPVIGSNIGAIPELLNQVDKNLLFKPSNVESLVETVTKFLELSPSKKQGIISKGVSLVANKYYWSDITKSLVDQIEVKQSRLKNN